MKSIHPVCKFVGILIPAVLLALFYRPLLNLVVFAVCMILMLVTDIEKKRMLPVLLPALVAAVGMFVTGYYFPSGSDLGISTLPLANTAVLNGLQLSSRVLAFTGLGLLFALTTDPVCFVRVLEQQIHLPPRFTYGILAAFTMLPHMQHEYNKTRAAFRARGLSPMPASPAVLVPLLVKSVRWAESLSIAMESKGFDGSSQRTQYEKIKAGPLDLLFPILSCLLLCMGFIFL